MKKKLALLLAAVMVLSPISAFAATVNHVDSAKAGIPKKAVYMQKEWEPKAGGNVIGLGDDKTDDVEYLMTGSDFVMRIDRDKIKPGDKLILRLDNAEWFFRNENKSGTNGERAKATTPKASTAIAATTTATVFTATATVAGSGYYDSLPNEVKTYLAANETDYRNGMSDAVTGSGSYNYKYSGSLASTIDSMGTRSYDGATFDRTRGQLLNLTNGIYAYVHHGSGVDVVAGTPTEATATDIPYVITFNIREPQIATLHVLSEVDTAIAVATATSTSLAAAQAKAENDAEDLYLDLTSVTYGIKDAELRVPLVTLATGEGEAKIYVAQADQTSQITAGSYVFGNASGSGTKTTIKDVTTSKYDFELSNLTITENAIASIKNTGSFILTAPYGYTWADPSKYDAKADRVSLSTNAAITLKTKDNTNVAAVVEGQHDFIGYVYDRNNEADRQRLLINLQGSSAKNPKGVQISDVTRAIKAVLTLDNLRLVADDYASYDSDVSISIADFEYSPSNMHPDTYKSGFNGIGVTDEDVKVAVRKDWGVTLTVDKDKIPTLFNGRFAIDYYSTGSTTQKRVDLKAGQFTKDSNVDKNHKAATVTFKENVVSSWWSQRQTDLTVNEGVKYIQVKIDDLKNFDDAKNVKFKGEHPFNEKKDGNIHVTGNKVILTNLYVTANKTASFTVQSWLSIEPGFEGDVVMTASGSGITEKAEDGPSVVIAKAINPVNIETSVTDVRISLQNQKVADITLTETAPGALLMNKELVLSVYDDISQDGIYFDNSSIVYEKTGNVSFTRPVAKNGNITTTIDRISDKNASSIKFSNVYVKTDRNVPQSNERPYRVYVGGNAVVNNYEETYRGYQPFFSTRGVHADFLNVVTQADETIGALASDVKFTVGDTSVWIGKTTPREIVMDTAPYISATSNSLMLPVRYVAAALGIPKDGVVWDEANRTVTILIGTKVIQFTLDSSTIKVNGAEYTMYSLDTPPLVTSAETKDDRSFLPVRQIAIALGVNVEWNKEDQTATFNTNQYKGTVADVEKEETETAK